MMRSSLLVFVFVCIGFYLQAQPFVGLWEIKSVLVGDAVKTPVARWTRILADGSHQSGNGWLQHSYGSWTFDEETQAFSPQNENGISDEFGPFALGFEGKTMVWQREEEGMQVTVKLERIEELPRSTSDKLQGLWELHAAERHGEDYTSEFDPEGLHYLFIRWDRVVMARNAKGKREFGYWHINGHRPDVTFIWHAENQEDENWRVVVSDTELTMSGISDNNKGEVRTYQLRKTFPE